VMTGDPLCSTALLPSTGGLKRGAAEQADAADEARLDACGTIIVGRVIVNEGKVVRASQLIRSVRPTRGE
jgi:hypothetical protein